MTNEKYVIDENDAEYRLVFSLYKEKNDFPDLFVYVKFNDTFSFLNRLIFGLKYLFGYKCRYGDVMCFEFSDNDKIKIKDMLDEYKKRLGEFYDK